MQAIAILAKYWSLLSDFEIFNSDMPRISHFSRRWFWFSQWFSLITGCLYPPLFIFQNAILFLANDEERIFYVRTCSYEMSNIGHLDTFFLKCYHLKFKAARYSWYIRPLHHIIGLYSNVTPIYWLFLNLDLLKFLHKQKMTPL